jgi:hypothetical protein
VAVVDESARVRGGSCPSWRCYALEGHKLLLVARGPKWKDPRGETVVEDRSRSELFGEVLLLLESAAETAAGNGEKDAESHIRGTLVPFLQKEHHFAKMAEEE